MFTSFLIATVTAVVVGVSETSPGICEVNYLVEVEYITTERLSCDAVPPERVSTI